MSSLTLDDIRCPECGRVARVVRHESVDSRLTPIDGDTPICDVRPVGGFSWIRCGGCSRAAMREDGAPTLRKMLSDDGGLPIGPGLGRLLVEALERGATPAEPPPSVKTGPNTDEIRDSLRTMSPEDVLEWAVTGASPPVHNCGHRGDDGCCNYPDHVSAECHAGAPCPLVTIRRTPLPPGEGYAALEEARELTAQLRALDEWTSAPPPPSPDGVTWYRWNEYENQAYTHMAVQGSHYGIASAGYTDVWDCRFRLADWSMTNGERRSAHPVPRPEWAEGGDS